MAADPIVALLWAGALGSGLVTGTTFAFSAFVMAALDRLPAAQAVAAMQAINRVILRSAFMPVFFATTLAGLALAVAGALRWGEAGAAASVSAGLLIVVGVFGCTAALNVPLNDRLDRVDAAGGQAADAWHRYRRAWIRWNHLRTGAGLAACALCIAGLTAR